MASLGLAQKSAFALVFLLGAGTAQAQSLSGHVRSARRARWKACWLAHTATDPTSP